MCYFCILYSVLQKEAKRYLTQNIINNAFPSGYFKVSVTIYHTEELFRPLSSNLRWTMVEFLGNAIGL